MCQPNMFEVEGFSTIGTGYSITPHPLRRAPWDESSAPALGTPRAQHKRPLRQRAEHEGDSSEHSLILRGSGGMPPLGPRSCHVGEGQPREHQSARWIGGQGSTSSSSSSSYQSGASTATWHSQTHRQVSFAPARVHALDMPRSEATRLGPTAAALEDPVECSADEMVPQLVLQESQGDQAAVAGEAIQEEEADLHALETKLELITLQRNLSAVKCEIFLDYLETQQKKQATGQSKPPASVASPGHRRSYAPSPGSTRQARRKGLSSAGSTSFKDRRTRHPPALHIPDASPVHPLLPNPTRSAASTPRHGHSSTFPGASPFRKAPASCRAKAAGSPGGKASFMEWGQPGPLSSELHLASWQTHLRKEQSFGWKCTAEEAGRSSSEFDTDSDSDDELSAGESNHHHPHASGPRQAGRWTAEGLPACGDPDSLVGCFSPASERSRQKNSRLSHLASRECSRFSPCQHVPVLPMR